MQGWTATINERFCPKLLFWGQCSGNKNKKPFNDQSNVNFYLWSLLPLDDPKSAETWEYFGWI